MAERGESVVAPANAESLSSVRLSGLRNRSLKARAHFTLPISTNQHREGPQKGVLGQQTLSFDWLRQAGDFALYSGFVWQIALLQSGIFGDWFSFCIKSSEIALKPDAILPCHKDESREKVDENLRNLVC